MCVPSFGGKKKSSGDDEYAKETARRAAAVREGMAGINSNFAQFDDDYFDQRKQDYVNWATPQVDKQYDEAYKQLVYALSGKGLLNSSVGADETAKLEAQKLSQRRGVIDAGRAAADSARADVANQKSELVNQLNQTYDPTATLTNAQTRTQLLQSKPAYQSLGDLFVLPASLGANAITAERLNGGNGGTGARLFSDPAGSSTRLIA